MRTTTAELFPAVLDPTEVSLQVLLEAARGPGLAFEVALDLGAAVSERVGAVHASGRVVGPLDARAVRCTREGTVLLSRDGMALAPELGRGEPPSVASDVFAVGHVVYQVLTGRTPAQASVEAPLGTVPPPSCFNPKVDAELDAVVLAALRDEAQGRPASVLALQSALDGLAEELGLCPDPRALGQLVSTVAREKVAAAPLADREQVVAAGSASCVPVEVSWFLDGGVGPWTTRAVMPAAAATGASAGEAVSAAPAAPRPDAARTVAEAVMGSAPSHETLRVADGWLEAPPPNVGAAEEIPPPLDASAWSSPRLLAGVPIAAFLVLGLALAWPSARTAPTVEAPPPASRPVVSPSLKPQPKRLAASTPTHKPAARAQLRRAPAPHVKHRGR